MTIITNRHKNQFCRTTKINFGSKILTTPTYFPAISSVEKFHDLYGLLKLLSKSSYPKMLISAYDYYYHFQKYKKIIALLKTYSKKHFLFLDSGGYEHFWLNKKWNRSIYEKLTPEIQSDFYTSFDSHEKLPKVEKFIDDVINDGSLNVSSQYIPIFYSKTPNGLLIQIKKFLKQFPHAINFLAVKEKELGTTIIERSKTILSIRKEIDAIGGEHVLHVLGVGHPTSISLYSYCGADSFDSTDWYNFSLDISTLNLKDISHLPLISNPSPAIVKLKNPLIQTFVNNLDSYSVLMSKIQNMIKTNKLEEYLQKIGISKKILDEIFS
jgi:queuine/archaeosine tRNA-ribosyltransferase